MAKRKKKKVAGAGDNVALRCPHPDCLRYYTVKRDKIREDKLCWHCAHGLRLSKITAP